MKRKKWTETEEQTLIGEYSSLLATAAVSNLRSREKKFSPMADRVNALHHLADPIAFPFRWSWRDVSIKIQNMRHQFFGVKQKLRHLSSDLDGSHLWPNFPLYKQVFGDLDDPDSGDDEETETAVDDEGDELGLGLGQGALDLVRRRVEELGEMAMRREEDRREREEKEDRRRLEVEMDGGDWRRRREERREREEMEWRERAVGMQMEHEKQVMQMHAEACQVQMQVIGVLARIACQFLGNGSGGGDGGMQGLHQHQHQQQSPGSLVDDDRKNDGHSGEHYL